MTIEKIGQSLMLNFIKWHSFDFRPIVLIFRLMLTVPIFVCMIYSILGIPSSILDNGCYATETCWSLRVARVLWGSNTIHDPTEPVANYLNHAVVIHPTDCKPEFALKLFYGISDGWSRCLIQLCDGLLLGKTVALLGFVSLTFRELSNMISRK